MDKKFQWKVQIDINAPVEKVWSVVEDISSIPQIHPDVRSVQFVSGQTKRAPEVEYMCVVPDGPRKGSCVEKVVEHIEYQKTSTVSVQDSWGLGDIITDFITDVNFESINKNTTRLIMIGYYRTKGIKNTIINALFVRRTMRKRGKAVLMGYKNLIEKHNT
jgi:Polyketide cyclase / dehydrase and lipid transport.